MYHMAMAGYSSWFLHTDPTVYTYMYINIYSQLHNLAYITCDIAIVYLYTHVHAYHQRNL